METANNADIEGNINSDSDDSVSEVEDLEKLGQPQQNWNEGGNTDIDNDFDFDDNMETANNVDEEVNSNSDSDDSDSEAEHLEKLWQRQQNWNEGEDTDTDDDYDSYDDTDYELLQANFLADFAKTEYKLLMQQQKRPSQCIA